MSKYDIIGSSQLESERPNPHFAIKGSVANQVFLKRLNKSIRGLKMFQMIGAEWCDKCLQAKKLLQERGLWGYIKYINYDSPEGKEIAAKLGVEKIPFFVEDGKLFQYVGEVLHRLNEERIKEDYGSEN